MIEKFKNLYKKIGIKKILTIIIILGIVIRISIMNSSKNTTEVEVNNDKTTVEIKNTNSNENNIKNTNNILKNEDNNNKKDENNENQAVDQEETKNNNEQEFNKEALKGLQKNNENNENDINNENEERKEQFFKKIKLFLAQKTTYIDYYLNEPQIIIDNFNYTSKASKITDNSNNEFAYLKETNLIVQDNQLFIVITFSSLDDNYFYSKKINLEDNVKLKYFNDCIIDTTNNTVKVIVENNKLFPYLTLEKIKNENKKNIYVFFNSINNTTLYIERYENE